MARGKRIHCNRCEQQIPVNSQANDNYCRHCYQALKAKWRLI
jgi:late competence protein required for DNA uptake (superfamily II DNA/RNA helicase)